MSWRRGSRSSPPAGSSASTSTGTRSIRRLWPEAGSIRKGRFVDPGDDPQRVLVIDLLQHLVRQVEAVEAPEGVALAVVGEVLVRRLQRAEISVVLLGRPGI